MPKWSGLIPRVFLTSRHCTAASTMLAPQPFAFDLLMAEGNDLRRRTYVERKAASRKLLRGDRGIQYVEHAEGHGDKLFDCLQAGREGIVSKKLDAPYRSGKSKAWIKVKNPKAPAATRAQGGAF